MTDQIPADLADKVRKLAARFRQQMEPHTPAAECAVWECAAEAVEALLPPRPTLADMTPDERDECRGMQADLAQGDRVVILDGHLGLAGRVRVLEASLDTFRPTPGEVTPRPDLPRMEWPGAQKTASAPALPDGWRLADHHDYGRVIVTTEKPDDDCLLAFVHRDDDLHRGHGYDWCKPDELTYLDQEDDTPTGPDHLAVGTVIESADDPRLPALPYGSILLDRDEEATTKRLLAWTGRGYPPIPSEGAEFGPWTVLHIPKETDQ